MALVVNRASSRRLFFFEATHNPGLDKTLYRTGSKQGRRAKDGLGLPNISGALFSA